MTINEIRNGINSRNKKRQEQIENFRTTAQLPQQETLPQQNTQPNTYDPGELLNKVEGKVEQPQQSNSFVNRVNELYQQNMQLANKVIAGVGNTLGRFSQVGGLLSLGKDAIQLTDNIRNSADNGVHKGNIDIFNRPIVRNEDGSVSTLLSFSFYDDKENKEILIPTIIDGKKVSEDEAIEHYYKTGEYLGKFDTPEEATAYGEKLSEEEGKRVDYIDEKAKDYIAKEGMTKEEAEKQASKDYETKYALFHPIESLKSTAGKIDYVSQKSGQAVIKATTDQAKYGIQESKYQMDEGTKQSILKSAIDLGESLMRFNPKGNTVLLFKDTLENIVLGKNSKRNKDYEEKKKKYEEIWNNDEKSIKDKITMTIEKGMMDIKEIHPLVQVFDNALKTYGSINKDNIEEINQQLDEVYGKVSNATDSIDEYLSEERAKQDKGTKKAGDIFATSYYSGTTAAEGRITGTGLLPMGVAVAGSTSDEMMKEGYTYEETRERALRKGVLAAAIEKATGGAKLFGNHGALDGLVDDAILSGAKKITSDEGRKLFITIMKHLANDISESGEEVSEDWLNTLFDQADYDPNAKYTLEEMWDTIKDTVLSTELGNLMAADSGVDELVEKSDTSKRIKNTIDNSGLSEERTETLNKFAEKNNLTEQEVNELVEADQERYGVETNKQKIEKLVDESDLSDGDKASLKRVVEKNGYDIETVKQVIENRLNEQNQATTMQNNEVSQDNQQTNQEQGKISQNEDTQETNDVVRNLMKSVDEYNNSRSEGEEIFDINNEETKTEIETLGKLASERGVNIKFDASRFDNSSQNAFYEYDDKGNVSNIILNPNTTSKKYVQNLTIHEMVHSFSGDKQGKLMNEVLNYAKTLPGYNKAFQDISNTYKKIYGDNVSESVINEEVVANILGEKLGNKEFVNDLINGKYATQNRNFVQRIYEFVKNQINRFKGYKDQQQYWKHVKELFDDAYRNSEINEEGLKNSAEANKMTNIKDSQGRNLSEGQVEYFKDSKVRDKDGNLIKVFHGTPTRWIYCI